MKKVFFSLVAIFLIISACQKSQFSTTTRHSRNGKTTYVNHYPAERNKSSKVHKNHLKETKSKNNISPPNGPEKRNRGIAEISKDCTVRITNPVGLIACTSDEPIIFISNINLYNSCVRKNNTNHDYFRETINYSSGDTIKGKTTAKDLTLDPSFAHTIRFKSGKEEKVRIMSHAHDTLYYRLISEPAITRSIMMEKVDTILTDTTIIFKPEEKNTLEATESNQKKGFSFSYLGFIPVIGIPFAIIGIIMGARHLRRIKRNLESIQGKKPAQSGIAIGIVALILNIIISALLIAAATAAASSAFTTCASGITLDF